MSDIKIENCDPHTTNPIVIDVMSGDEAITEPMATHVLKFGDFVIVQAVDNLKSISYAEKVARDAEAAKAAEEKAAADKAAQA